MSLISELKRRNVFKVGVAYLVTAWLVMQVVDVFLNNVSAPAWVFHVIVLVLGIGFPFALIFAWAFELTPEGLKRDYEVDRAKSITHQTGRKLDFAIIGMLILALGYFVYDKFVLDPKRDAALVAAATEAAGQAPDHQTAEAAVENEKAIAVLPFVNMSSDPEQEYFADGISEEILNALAKVGGLKVAGRTSSFAFKGRNEDLNAIGQALRVSHILEGSVRKSGNRVRITAQLIQVDDGFHLWSETWDRELADIFAIQDEISAAILGEMKAQLLGQLEPTADTDTGVYENYLAAKQLIYTRNQASLQRAADMLREAVEIDGGYAPAWAQLGIATILLSDRNYGDVPQPESWGNAREHLDRALQLDPANAEAMAGMGLFYADRSQNDESIDWLRKALAINPNLVNANSWLATALSSQGLLQEALEVLQRNYERDPLHEPTYTNLTDGLARVGRGTQALEIIEHLKLFQPGEASIDHAEGVVYWIMGETSRSLPLIQRAYELEPFNQVIQLWYGGVLMWLLEYEQGLEVASRFVRQGLLSRMGRMEEALISGSEFVGQAGYPYFYLETLIMSGQQARLLEEIDTRWGGLAAFDQAWPDRDGYGADMLGLVALACRATGDKQCFQEAMHLMRASLDAQLAQGADNWLISLSEANYAALEGDVEASLRHVERMVEQGGMYDPARDSEFMFLRVLRGEPRYEAARQKLIDHLNGERLALGLDPVEI